MVFFEVFQMGKDFLLPDLGAERTFTVAAQQLYVKRLIFFFFFRILRCTSKRLKFFWLVFLAKENELLHRFLPWFLHSISIFNCITIPLLTFRRVSAMEMNLSLKTQNWIVCTS